MGVRGGGRRSAARAGSARAATAKAAGVVIDDTVSDKELQKLHDAGVRGARFNFWKVLNLVPTPEAFNRAIDRIKDMGWYIKLHVPIDELIELKALFEPVKLNIVMDHFGRPEFSRGIDHLSIRFIADVLKKGNWWVMLSNGDRWSTMEKPWDDAVEFATTIAPGLRDVLLTGKIKEVVTRTRKEAKGKYGYYDAVVVDSPPTGRIARFLDVTKAVSDLAKGGPVHSQADGVVRLLHSDLTAIHLVTLLEALPVQETLEAITELRGMELPIGSVIINRNIPAYLPADDLVKAAEGGIDADAIRSSLNSVGITLSDNDFAGLLTETIEHATRIAARAESAEQLVELDIPRLDLPALPDGVDLGSLYELAEALAQQGVR